MTEVWRHLPNALSVSRIPAAIIFLIVFSYDNIISMIPGICVLIYALVSDVLDGILARRLSVTTKTGYFLDGLGDRAVSVAIILTVLRTDDDQLLLAWLLIFREVAIYALRALGAGDKQSIESLRWASIAQAGSIRFYFAGFLIWCAISAAGLEGDDWLQGYVLFGILAVIFGYVTILGQISILIRQSDGQW